ncbi:MAG: Peptidase protein [Patescibacteria group bacterium]|jgi:biotin carboxyl carrier protein|nr:Peptidase protein [Patescibacteria group bacterium]
MSKNNKQSGFALLEALLVLVIIAVLGGIGFFVLSKDKKSETVTSENAATVATESKAKIKSIGINLEEYDPATGMAGDLKFTKANFASGMQMLFSEYGYEVAASSAGPAKKNPQPTFIAPLGTKVMALVDGEVVNVPKLYSNDYSVHVQAQGSDLIFETEHVINVKVKQGDKVKAGQVIAEVSDYDAKNYDGLGLFEIGVLKGGNPPSHLCLFDYLDDSIKSDTQKNILSLQKAWEEYRGDTTIYDEAKAVTPGCLTRDPIEG